MTVIQIADRAGFDYFLRRLDILLMHYSIHPVSVECYNIAKYGASVDKDFSSASVNGTGKVQKLTIDMTQGVPPDGRQSLLHTPREAFRLIKIWK